MNTLIILAEAQHSMDWPEAAADIATSIMLAVVFYCAFRK